jgi:hypothetical protein
MGYVKFTYCLIAYLILFSCSYKSVPYYEDDDLTKGSLVTVSEINGYKSSKVKSKEKVYAVVNKLTEGYEIKVAPKSYAAKDSKKVFYTSINKLQYFNNKQGYKMPRSEKYVYFGMMNKSIA